MTGSPFATSNYPTGVAVDPTGRFAYVSSGHGSGISAYTINMKTGALTAVTGSPFAGGNWTGAAFDPSGKFAYFGGGGGIFAFAINARTGALTAVAGSPFATGTGGFQAEVAVDPRGRFAYVANRDTNNVSAFTIDAASGALTPIAGSPFAAGNGPWGVVVDSTDRFLYVANSFANTISAYNIDATTGALTPLAGSPFSSPNTGAGSFEVVVDPTGKFAFVGTNGPYGGAYVYAIDPRTGALAEVGGEENPATGYVAVDPSGNFLYDVNSYGNNVYAFTVDAKTGELNPLAASPFAAGNFPSGIAVTRPHRGDFHRK